MAKFLIVDDEEIIRRGIRNKVVKLIDGAQIVGEAEDGEEALAMAEMHQPDIIITDIKMPKLDGLLFIESVQGICPGAHFIIVSGYQDFSFAQKALKLGVCDYLLKPVNNDELKKAIDKLLERMDVKRAQQQYIDALKSRTSGNELLYKNSLFSKLLSGTLNDKAALKAFGISSPDKPFVVLTVRIKSGECGSWFNQDEPLIRFAAANVFEETVSRAFLCNAFESSPNIREFTAIVYDCADLKSLTKQVAEAVSMVRELMGMAIYVGVGNAYFGLEKIGQSNVESQQAVQQKIVFASSDIILYEDFCKVKCNNYILSENKRKMMENFLMAGDFDNTKNLIENIFYEIVEKKIVFSKTEDVAIEILLIMVNVLKAANKYDNVDYDQKSLENGFRDCVSYEDFRRVLIARAAGVCENVSQTAAETAKEIIKKIVERLEDEYYKDVKLSDIADEYYINISYLSQVFFQETQKNFKQYLSEIRINNAKNLLENTNFSISKIAELIGYNDRGYFSKVFVKYTGLTPAQYRSGHAEKAR